MRSLKDLSTTGATITKLASQTGLTKKKAREVFDALAAIIYTDTKHLGAFVWAGFGTFYRGSHKARRVRFPNGQLEVIDGVVTMKFRASSGIKDKLNNKVKP